MSVTKKKKNYNSITASSCSMLVSFHFVYNGSCREGKKSCPAQLQTLAYRQLYALTTVRQSWTPTILAMVTITNLYAFH